MKRKHTKSKKANRTFDKSITTRGKSNWLLFRLFSKKPNSKTSKLNLRPKQITVPYTGQKLGKQHNTQHKSKN